MKKMLSKNDILHALGIEEEREDRFVVGMLVGVGIGALLGGVIAMLVTPRSGAELRSAIGDKGRAILGKARGREATAEAGTSAPPL